MSNFKNNGLTHDSGMESNALGASNNPTYVCSFEIKVKRIEIYSFSKLAVPYYWVQTKKGVEVFGGAIIGRLQDMDDPILEARLDSNFICNVCGMHSNYDYAVANKTKVADSGEFDGRVLVDVYQTSKGHRYAVGGSNFVYGKSDDGKTILYLDEIELKRQGILE